MLSVVDKKGREHSIELTDYNSFLNEGHEFIECQQIGGDCEVLSHTDYYRDGLSPLTMIPSDSDHMSADVPDDATFLEMNQNRKLWMLLLNQHMLTKTANINLVFCLNPLRNQNRKY